MRVGVWLLVGAAALRLVSGPAAPTCVSCCPASSGPETTISSLGCCDQGCGEKIARGYNQPCLASVQRAAAVWVAGALPVRSCELARVAWVARVHLPGADAESPPAAQTAPLRL